MIEDSFFAAITGFLVYLFAVAIFLRLWPKNPPFITIGTTVPVFAIVVCGALLLGGKISFWSFSAIYGALVLSFLMVFGAVYKSISLRLLLDLYECPQRSSSYQEVLERLVRQDSYDARIDVMQEAGFARLSDGHLILEEKGLRLARTVQAIQTLFGIEKSG